MTINAYNNNLNLHLNAHEPLVQSLASRDEDIFPQEVAQLPPELLGIALTYESRISSNTAVLHSKASNMAKRAFWKEIQDFFYIHSGLWEQLLDDKWESLPDEQKVDKLYSHVVDHLKNINSKKYESLNKLNCIIDQDFYKEFVEDQNLIKTKYILHSELEIPRNVEKLTCDDLRKYILIPLELPIEN